MDGPVSDSRAEVLRSVRERNAHIDHAVRGLDYMHLSCLETRELMDELSSSLQAISSASEAMAAMDIEVHGLQEM